MRMLVSVCLAGAFSFCALLPEKKEESRYTEEMKWTRQLLFDFFEAALESRSSAIGLFSPELAKAVQDGRESDVFGLLGAWQYGSPKIVSAAVAPGGAEVVFSGTLTEKAPEGQRKATFKVRMTRDSQEGKWSIRYVMIKQQE